MTQARSKQVSLQDTRYYHLISRCVRRAYLCGEDHHTKQSFEHRRQWMVDRIRFLTSVLLLMSPLMRLCQIIIIWLFILMKVKQWHGAMKRFAIVGSSFTIVTH